MRVCPFHNCGRRIRPNLFACPRHWFSLPPKDQAEVHAAYDEWKAGKIKGAELRRRQQAVLGELGYADGPPEQPRDAALEDLARKTLAMLDLQAHYFRTREGLDRCKAAERELRRECGRIVGGGPAQGDLFEGLPREGE